jgi:D-methionine transport system ATP-binding protein
VVESGNVIDVFLSPQHATTRALLAESGVETESWQEASRNSNSRILRLTYRGAVVATPVLSELARELTLDFSILQGSIGRIKDIPYGELTIAVERHDEPRLQRLLEQLAQREIRYEVLR